MFSNQEKEKRHKAIEYLIEKNKLNALILIGDAGNGYGFFGDYRYYTNNRTITYREIAVVLPYKKPVLFTTTTRKITEIVKRSFIETCFFSDDLIADVVRYLKEQGISSGSIGVSFEMLSYAWYQYLKNALPKIDIVDIHEQIMDIRFNRSKEEMDVFRKGAALADGSFEESLKAIKPGASEFEIVAAIEKFSRARGAEEHFTLIGTGKFSFENGTNLIFYYPTHRRLEIGDSILMEITPRYEGYWTQVVRAVNVGKTNADLEAIQNVCRGAIEVGLEKLRPGRKISEVVNAMEQYVVDKGYILKPPYGHISGIDLIEGRVSPKNNSILAPGVSVVIHPTIFTKDERNWSFCGETYLITDDGYERLNKVDDGVLTL